MSSCIQYQFSLPFELGSEGVKKNVSFQISTQWQNIREVLYRARFESYPTPSPSPSPFATVSPLAPVFPRSRDLPLSFSSNPAAQLERSFCYANLHNFDRLQYSPACSRKSRNHSCLHRARRRGSCWHLHIHPHLKHGSEIRVTLHIALHHHLTEEELSEKE